ncbi:uncharacterized protein LOC123474643 [Daphnia magna]|uniref:uncharacterized protein LOC123474643 n=1 Tax=Daphnia magna TaxID=35525 RepID=UPI0006DE35B7|nr:uncharacterized protein LOC123474643 [Daphnia magna]
MMKGLIVAICLLLATVDAGVIFGHQIVPNYYLHSGLYPYHQWIPLHYVASPGILNSREYDPVVAHHAVDGGDVSRSNYPFNNVEGRHRDDNDSNYGEATIPNYRMFHFVLKLVRSMRKHFLPVYATNPEDISNIYVQYENEKRR